MNEGFEGTVVIVKGASGGSGHSMAEALAEAGARVLAIDQNQTKLDTLIGEGPEEDHLDKAMVLKDPECQCELVSLTTDQMGGLHALILTADLLILRAQLGNITERDWDSQIDTHFKATFFLSRHVVNVTATRAEIESFSLPRIVGAPAAPRCTRRLRWAACRSRAAWPVPLASAA